jgi:hypothetical protein
MRTCAHALMMRLYLVYALSCDHAPTHSCDRAIMQCAHVPTRPCETSRGLNALMLIHARPCACAIMRSRNAFTRLCAHAIMLACSLMRPCAHAHMRS